MWNKYRNLLVFLSALILYLICLDRGASLWDCPEYILTAWRLEIGHPPGNPTWQLLANVVSHLGFSAGNAAVIINALSALAMALASAFLSEIIYLLLKASLFAGEDSSGTKAANWCAGAAALCYAWCDSAIFSAVEAEVYALSAFFTSLMLLLALKWYRRRSKGEVAASRRILILTAYLAGLGVGVHELNFLIIPTILLIYYYGVRSYPLHLPVSGTLQTGIWSLCLFLVGTTTYLIIPIRAAANPPVNTGNPSSWESFFNYYTREQYGAKPLLYGRTPYSRPILLEQVDSSGYHYNRYYLRDNGRGHKEYVYPCELDVWFPRMTSNRAEDLEFYEAWTGMTPENMIKVEASQVADSTGRQMGRMNPITGEREKTTTYKPTFLQQLRYLAGYQIGYMYMRYLLWNFSGRQNNVASTGEINHGNFITGVPPIDNAMLGDQDTQPSELRELNAGYNRYFMIPFILGILGIVALVRDSGNGRKVCSIIAVFFLFTGLLIVIYLNQDPGEPRERDYSFLGSYMAFSIWIAAGMAAVVKFIFKIRSGNQTLRKWKQTAAALFCIAVPLQMLSQTFDDHNRSNRPGAEDVARRNLESLPGGAIAIVTGDNIIFPMWYGQEVLGLRRDVTIVAMPYLTTPWYWQHLKMEGEGAPGLILTDSIPEGIGSKLERAIRDIEKHNSHRPIFRQDSTGKLQPVEKAGYFP